jgi:aconitate hydratase
VKGPNISSLPELSPLPDEVEAPVLLKVGDNISTDEISPAGARALPFRSNIPKLAMFSFAQIDDSYPDRAQQAEGTGHIIVGGENYGQGSSREHAAIAPRYLGCGLSSPSPSPASTGRTSPTTECWPSSSRTPTTRTRIDQGGTLRIQHLRDALSNKDTLQVDHLTKKSTFTVRHRLSPRQVKDVLAGGLIGRLAEEEN